MRWCDRRRQTPATATAGLGVLGDDRGPAGRPASQRRRPQHGNDLAGTQSLGGASHRITATADCVVAGLFTALAGRRSRCKCRMGRACLARAGRHPVRPHTAAAPRRGDRPFPRRSRTEPAAVPVRAPRCPSDRSVRRTSRDRGDPGKQGGEQSPGVTSPPRHAHQSRRS